MSWQKCSIQLILGLPLSLPIVTYAVNIGDTYVQSQQNQPLNASINVTDIDPANFSVKIANPDAYRQLGLSKDSDVSVRFEPTSSNGGKIVLTTNQPVNAPFTDVVLDINNNGTSKTLPKTLLMPLDNVQAITTQSETDLIDIKPKPIIVGQNNQVDLPIVSNPEPEIVTTQPIIETPTTVETPVVSTQLATTNSSEPLAETVLNNRATDNLKVEETRRVYPAGTVPPALTEQPLETLQATTQTPTQPKSDTTKAEEEQTTNTTTTDSGTMVYVIQRNDNLWTIANQLAKKNNKDVNTVMKEIMTANPNAFPDNDPSKLQVNMELEVPKYEVMPSQLGVKAATSAKAEATKKTTTKQSTSKSYSASKPKSTKTTVAKKPTSSTKKAVTTRKKTEMQIIAPSQKAGSVQGGNKTGKGTNPAIAQVQKKRQATAQKATKVSSLNQSLVDAEKRLKLQNDKLAQLEKRLKELKKK